MIELVLIYIKDKKTISTVIVDTDLKAKKIIQNWRKFWNEAEYEIRIINR